jgi:hypothetical protein
MYRFMVAIACALALIASPAAWAAQAVEYYHAAWNYYFVTAFPDEIAVLDSGAFGGVWKRTGQTFEVLAQPAAGASPTCRFFSTSFAPKSSHFYTPFNAECNGLKAGDDWQYESVAFYLQLPNAAGNCPVGTVTLYRLYNQGMGGAPNHRYTTNVTIFNQMQAAGWVFEGNGLTGAFACVPPTGAVAQTAEGLWTGSTSRGSALWGIVLSNGKFYVIYSEPGSNYIAGVVAGTSTASGGSFHSTSARDFNIGVGVFNATVNGTYVPRTSFQGSVSESVGTLTFSATQVPGYDQPASLAALAGNFSGSVASSAGWQSAQIAISPTGAISGNAAGCAFTGTASPHGSVNVFDVSVTFHGGGCIFGFSTLSGVGYYDSVDRVLYGVAANAAATDGFLFVGGK